MYSVADNLIVYKTNNTVMGPFSRYSVRFIKIYILQFYIMFKNAVNLDELNLHDTIY